MDAIKAYEAKKLREAFRETGECTEGEAAKVLNGPRGDTVEIIAPLSGGPDTALLLTISREGQNIASIPVTNAILKRLKSEMGFWKRIHSRSALAFRHGNRG